jgi:hypothetical protein
MLIFNTTYLVADKMHGTWHKWLYEHYIPSMLESGYFDKPQVAKVLTNEQQEGVSFSVQFHISTMDLLESWNEKYAQAFLADFTKRFGQEVLLFSTVLEIIE